MKFKCDRCKNEYDIEKLKFFEIPTKSCAVTHAVTIFERSPCYICVNCYQLKGEPDYFYMGELLFKGRTLDDILKCFMCGTSFVKENEHTYKPGCGCLADSMRVSVGGGR